jgi:diketogulonate reductase-like aldo/keto reductase
MANAPAAGSQLAYGTGTALFKAGGHGTLHRPTVDAIALALRLGYTHLDGADGYGNEAELGVAVRESGLPRGSLFVTTKVSRDMTDIPGAIARSLERLQMDYVDL